MEFPQLGNPHLIWHKFSILQLSTQVTMGAFLDGDKRVFNGPLGRSLRSFTRTTHSLRVGISPSIVRANMESGYRQSVIDEVA